MKISISLLLLSLGLAFGAGYIALQVRQSEGHAFAFTETEIQKLKRKFREQKPVLEELNTTTLFSAQAGFELLDPRLVLSPSRGRIFSTTAALYRADHFCQPGLIHDASLEKTKTWIAFRCHQSARLPGGFFEQPPYMSPFGLSFAELARSAGGESFATADWLETHLPYFHALELSRLSGLAALEPRRQLLSQLDADTLLMMTSGQSWIGSERYILVRRSNELSGDFQRTLAAADYLIYSRADWDLFLTRYKVKTQDHPETGCAYRDDGLCWVRSSTDEKKIQGTMGFLFVLAIGIIVFCVLQIVRNIKNQRREEERKRFALQALTHELRTPLSSLVISSEQLFDQFESLPTPLKEPFLRIADDIQRLTRVAESSRNYLKSSESKTLVSFNFMQVPSINDFLTAALERYADDITIHYLERDAPFTLDRYWIATCLQNLVQNALQHGASPVVVEVKNEGPDLRISVSDAGEMNELDLKNIAKPFVKRAQSPGLGLGLTIVATVLTAMNSKLLISTKPTRFELRIGGLP